MTILARHGVECVALALLAGLGLMSSGSGRSGQVPLSIEVGPDEDVVPIPSIHAIITNNSSQPVMAYYVLSQHGWSPFETEGGGEGEDFQDTAIFGHRPIMPGEARKVKFREDMKPIVFEAALFEDGAWYGDPCWAGRIVRHRKIEYRTAKGALEALERALETQMTLDELNDLLVASEHNLAPASAPLEERQAAMATFTKIRTGLRSSDEQPMALVQRLEPVLEWLAPLLVRLRTSKPVITDTAPLPAPPLCKDMTSPAREQR